MVTPPGLSGDRAAHPAARHLCAGSWASGWRHRRRRRQWREQHRYLRTGLAVRTWHVHRVFAAAAVVAVAVVAAVCVYCLLPAACCLLSLLLPPLPLLLRWAGTASLTCPVFIRYTFPPEAEWAGDRELTDWLEQGPGQLCSSSCSSCTYSSSCSSWSSWSSWSSCSSSNSHSQNSKCNSNSKSATAAPPPPPPPPPPPFHSFSSSCVMLPFPPQIIPTLLAKGELPSSENLRVRLAAELEQLDARASMLRRQVRRDT